MDQIAYCDTPSTISHNIISPSISHIAPMHYVSTSSHYVTSTPTNFQPMALAPPPNHFDLVARKIHSCLGEYALVKSPICDKNHVSSPTLFANDK